MNGPGRCGRNGAKPDVETIARPWLEIIEVHFEVDLPLAKKERNGPRKIESAADLGRELAQRSIEVNRKVDPHVKEEGLPEQALLKFN
jgi:hypothetical protein